jgi:hypothetical protein
MDGWLMADWSTGHTLQNEIHINKYFLFPFEVKATQLNSHGFTMSHKQRKCTCCLEGEKILSLACPHQEGGGQSWKTTTHVLQCSDKVLVYKLTSMLILFSQKARPESKYHDAILVSGILLPHLVIPHEVPQITGIKLGLRM